MMKGIVITVLCTAALANGGIAETDLDVNNPSHAASLCASGDSNGLLIAHEKCNKFYKCLGEKPVELDCPNNLLYNIDYKYCDWPENVDCGSRTIEEKPESGNSNPSKPAANTDPSQAYYICAADGSDGTLIAHIDCDKFYKCSEGKPVPINCPPQHLYNAEKEYCDLPENVQCKETEVVKNGDKDKQMIDKGRLLAVKTDPTKAADICAAAGSDGTQVAHKDCHKFYICARGKPVALKCASNLLYNAELEYCDWPENVKCKDKSKYKVLKKKPRTFSVVKPMLSNKEPSQAKVICASEKSDGILIAHNDCDKFYKCLAGKPVTFSCPSTLLYNADLEYCDYPEHVVCKSRNVANKDTDKDSSFASKENKLVDKIEEKDVNKICADPDFERLLIAHKDCTKFYKCSKGKPIVRKCPTHLHYNAKHEYCDWPENVECDILETEEDNVLEKQSDSEASIVCAAADSEGELVTHEDCNKFYICSEGKPVKLTCPLDLLYNPLIGYCDWPYNVDCGIRKSESNSLF